ncbi:MAG: NADAR family protein [Anaerolineae bacterium]|nr:NADAR family protein [Anaerolineae bacterium]
MPIYFYSAKQEYGYFSNFSPHSVYPKEQWWPTTEHYFQAKKFAGTLQEEVIRRAKTPKQAAAMGRDRQRSSNSRFELVYQECAQKKNCFTAECAENAEQDTGFLSAIPAANLQSGNCCTQLVDSGSIVWLLSCQTCCVCEVWYTKTG